jgi:hypothetical protein
MKAYTIEITSPNAPVRLIEGLSLTEATIRQELIERSGWRDGVRAHIITPAQRLRGWVHPLMR